MAQPLGGSPWSSARCFPVSARALSVVWSVRPCVCGGLGRVELRMWERAEKSGAVRDIVRGNTGLQYRVDQTRFSNRSGFGV